MEVATIQVATISPKKKKWVYKSEVDMPSMEEGT